jgi:hypothetical protein
MQLEIVPVGDQYVARLYKTLKGSGYDTFGPADAKTLFEMLRGRGLDPMFIAEELAAAVPTAGAGDASSEAHVHPDPEPTITVTREGDKFRARVEIPGDPKGSWEAPAAVLPTELFDELVSKGLDPTGVWAAFRKFDIDMARDVERRWDARRERRDRSA